MNDERTISWQEFIRDLNLLARKMQAAGFYVEALFADSPYGWTVASILSTKLGIKLVDGPRMLASLIDGNTIGIVHGVSRTGNSYIPFREHKKIALYSAVDSGKIIKPDISVRDVQGWIRFPYEDESATYGQDA
jgi:hypothetical protein